MVLINVNVFVCFVTLDDDTIICEGLRPFLYFCKKINAQI